jgi:aryl-alcohol dehydrogenase-like predicted oxidoreductase
MDFWAYNPLCGGLLMKPPLETKGRFDNPVYQSIFGKPTFSEACDKFRRYFPTKEERLSHSLAWYSSCFSSLEERDSIIIGATSLSQLEQNLKIWDIYIKDGRMEKGVLENIEDLYKNIKKEDEPIYYYE